MVGIPAIVIVAAVTALELTKTGMLPGVHIDLKYEVFEVDLTCIVVVAALGCLLMFVYDLILSTLLRLARHKEVEIKELR